MDTIFALASARGKAGVSVVRISGPRAFLAVQELTGSLPAPRHAGLRQIRDLDGSHVDSGLVICFAEGQSFTGEESAELHLHGSIAIVGAVLRILSGMTGLRQADPGEFTRRALENERLDLAQVEGLADLIDAETEMQRKQALRVLSGALGEKAEQWRASLIRAAALLEATIDFADEEVPVDVSPEVLDLLDAVAISMDAEAKGAAISERIRDGFEVAIVGPPNIGKSTLLNALAGREAAITSEVAGTTRDVIEVRMDLSGLPVTFLDTAGLRETEDYVEGIGIARAIERAQQADLRVFLTQDGLDFAGLDAKPDDITAFGKSDLSNPEGFAISGKTGEGVSALIDRISSVLSERVAGAGVAIRERHRNCIEQSLVALGIARNHVLESSDRTELAAAELRSAVRSIEALIGRVDVENLLDEIFASFCIGK
jgi:tRNA modification GTPase